MTVENYLKKLVDFDTTSGVGADTDKAIAYLKDFFKQHGLIVRTYSYNDFPALVATAKDTKMPKILFQAHLDCVPANENILRFKVEKDKYLGRGVFDMKFAIAIYLKLVEELAKDIKQYDIGFMITTDEEVGGDNGVESLLKEGYSAEVCVLPDGGDNWSVESSAKGFALVEVCVAGKSAHGSRPWEGDSAVTRLISFLSKLQAEFASTQSADTDTLTISEISGGDAINQVPNWARATLDIRTTSNKSHQSKLELLEGLSTEHGVESSIKFSGLPLEVDLENKMIKNFIEVVNEVRGGNMEPSRSLGASDARFFAEIGVPTIVMRPRGGGSHGDGEWINKEDLAVYLEVLKKYIQKLK